MDFVAGLTDWIGESPPSLEAFRGARVLRAGSAHIKVIRESGRTVLGLHPLAPEEAASFDAEGLTTWGFRVITVLAEHLREHGQLPEEPQPGDIAREVVRTLGK
jgi:hypothetical protein